LDGIELTERAARELRRILAEQGPNRRSCLRVAVQGGGCGGFLYVLDLVPGPEPADRTFVTRGVTIVCDPPSLLYLDGAAIDFEDELAHRGFVFQNPHARASCPCGASFSILPLRGELLNIGSRPPGARRA
jgi:iron-sulfur cluster assembly protein